MALFSDNIHCSNVVKCSAVGCLNKLDVSSHLSFFKFPNDRTRCVQHLLMLFEYSGFPP